MGLTIANPAHDIRGRKVVDRNGNEIGEVDHLFIDEEERRVRFIEVSSGGFLGIGEKKFLIPIDAITGIEASAVFVDQTREHVASAPDYNPELVEQPSWLDYYAYYGYPPYWGIGYSNPPFPHDPPRHAA
jgi:sporulation protein YlmC with PRC-barrel domain